MNVIRKNTFLLILGLIYCPQQTAQAQEQGQAQEKESQIIGKQIYGLIQDSDQDPLVRKGRAEIHTQANGKTPVTYEQANFSVDSFDSSVGAIYITKLDINSDDPISTIAVDTGPINGITQPGSGISTGWGSVLFGEAGLVDSANPAKFIAEFKPYFKDNASEVQPYDYGWPLELVILKNNGESKLIKNYAMGRTAPKKLVLMPDQRSVWMLSGDGAGYLYFFVADDSRNLSKGQLFVADTAQNPVRLLPLSHTSTLKAKYRLKNMEFGKLFIQTQPQNEAETDTCENGFTFSQTVFGDECLKLKDKRNAGLFEPHRVSALSGIKAEFASYKDIRFDQETNTLILVSITGETTQFAVGNTEHSSSEYAIKERL